MLSAASGKHTCKGFTVHVQLFTRPRGVAVRSTSDASALVRPPHTTAHQTTELVGAHPEAVKRRQEAEKRKVSRQHDKQLYLANNTLPWVSHPEVPNLAFVQSAEKVHSVLYQQERESNRMIVVDFFSPACAACLPFAPKLRKLAEDNPDVLWLKVNIGSEDLRQWAESVGVTKVPYFQFYRRGERLKGFTANLEKVSTLRAELAASKECKDPACGS